MNPVAVHHRNQCEFGRHILELTVRVVSQPLISIAGNFDTFHVVNALLASSRLAPKYQLPAESLLKCNFHSNGYII